MDKKVGDERPDGTPRNELDKIKAQHNAMQEQILNGDEDELDWDANILPQQVGLTQVYADRDGKLWTIQWRDPNWKLERIWQIT